MQNFEIRLRRRGITREEILQDIRRVALERGRATVTCPEYDQYGQFSATTVIRNFKTWNSALKESGLALSNRVDRSNEELFENIADVWTSLGKQPFGNQMSETETGSKFSTDTYKRRFGSWNNALIAFANYLSGDDFPVAQTSIKNTVPSSVGKRTPHNINWRIRAKILIRDACICQMCGASPAKDPKVTLHVDHIYPWSKGGETVEKNLRTLCSICNIGKSDIVV